MAFVSRMNLIVLFFVITALMNLFSVSKPKEIDGVIVKKSKKLQVGKVAVDKLNIRAGVGKNYEDVGMLLRGELVIIEGEVSYPDVPSWLKIKAPKKAKLYIAKQFVDKTSGNKGIVKEDNVNIRAKSSTKATIVHQLNKGQEVVIISEKGDFYEIVPPDGVSLYVSKVYVEIIDEYVDEDAKDIVTAKKIINEEEFQKRFNDIIVKVVEEHAKDISSRNYNQYISELQKLLDVSPTNELKILLLDRVAKLKEFQTLVDNLKHNYIETANRKIEAIVNTQEKQPPKEIPIFTNPEPTQQDFSYKAVGYLESTGLYFGRPAPYKLINNKQIVCFIKSEKNLKKYLHKFVEVKGNNYKDKKGRNILEVLEIKVLDETF